MGSLIFKQKSQNLTKTTINNTKILIKSDLKTSIGSLNTAV